MPDEHLISLQPGTVIAGRYEVVKCLGAGSMGLVYACRHRELSGHMVAVKVLFPEVAQDKIAAARFRNEIFASYGVSHPNVVRAYEYIRDGDLLAYTMEYVGGGDLADKLNDRGGLPIAEIARLLGEMCAGVQAIHDAGIVHRDLKPENILLTKDGHVKIADFGIARTGHGPKLTEHGGVVGTIEYVSPEYMLNSQVDWRSDIYAIGILGYEMITGESPFTGDSVYAKMTKRLKSDPVAPSTHRPDCPPEMDRIVLKAMQRSPELRYQSMSEMFQDLHAAMPGTVSVSGAFIQPQSSGQYVGPSLVAPPAIEEPVREVVRPVPQTRSAPVMQHGGGGAGMQEQVMDGWVSAPIETPYYQNHHAERSGPLPAPVSLESYAGSADDTVVIRRSSPPAAAREPVEHMDGGATYHEPIKMEQVLAYDDIGPSSWNGRASAITMGSTRPSARDSRMDRLNELSERVNRSLWVDIVTLLLAVVLGVGLGFVALRTLFPDLISRRPHQALDVVPLSD